MEPPADAPSAGAGDEEHTDEPGGTPSDASSEGQESGATHRRRRLATPIRRLAAGALVAVLAVAGHEGWLLVQHHQNEVAARQALDAATKYAITLANIDSDAIDDRVAEILDGSMGEFKDLYNKSGAQLRQLLIDNRAVARGHVVEAAVKSASANKVQVLLFVDQSVSNLASPEPRIDRSRIRMTMEKVDGRWLVSRVELP